MNWNSKLNPLGNFDDPMPPATYKPEKSLQVRLVFWAFRNPLHNFTFYWIGVAGHVVSIIGEWKSPGLNFVQIKTRRFTFPLISCNGKRVEWYIGWRLNGAFGIALRKANAKQA